jgi:serpin B
MKMAAPTRPLCWLLLATVAATAACGDGSSAPAPPTELVSTQVRVASPVLQDGDLGTLAADNGRFAWDLYQAVRATPGNLAFSPASISIALAMAFGGARGTTADQMAATLHFSLPPARLHPTFDALDLALAPPPSGHLTLANALWAKSATTVLPDYLDLLAEDYGAGVHTVDFAHDPEGARTAINQWVSDQTSGKIPALLAPGVINTRTVLALTNAVYFHADWVGRFGAVNTNGTFQTSAGPVAATMMSAAPSAPGWTGAGYRAVALRYIDSDASTSMVLVVPDAGTFDAFEAGLTGDALEAILATAPTTMYFVTMPRFTAQANLPLQDTLAAMGMPDAFTPAADFSGITGTHDLFIDKVVHKATVAVDETGTTAAASTAATFADKLDAGGTGEPLVVDHPFLFAIRDDATGTILFLGRVVDPTKS